MAYTAARHQMFWLYFLGALHLYSLWFIQIFLDALAVTYSGSAVPSSLTVLANTSLLINVKCIATKCTSLEKLLKIPYLKTPVYCDKKRNLLVGDIGLTGIE